MATTKKEIIIDEKIKPTIDSIIGMAKKMMEAGTFKPAVILLFYMPKHGLQPYHIKGSEDVFEKGVDKKATILDMASKITKMIHSEIDADTKLLAVVCVTDVYFNHVEMSNVDMTEEEVKKFAKEYESNPGYIPPRLNPEAIEALCIVVNCPDKSYLFQYTYERKNDQVTFPESKHNMELDNAIGNLAEVFPDELK
jgi:hypothetical protein